MQLDFVHDAPAAPPALFAASTRWGWIEVSYGADAIHGCHFSRAAAPGNLRGLPAHVRTFLDEWDAFDSVQEFSGRFVAKGTPFEHEVWQALRRIPFGRTETYGGIARRVGRPKASRAVGLACNRNPLPLLIPCHRVVGANGKLVGFAGGLGVKERLLAMERNELPLERAAVNG